MLSYQQGISFDMNKNALCFCIMISLWGFIYFLISWTFLILFYPPPPPPRPPCYMWRYVEWDWFVDKPLVPTLDHGGTQSINLEPGNSETGLISADSWIQHFRGLSLQIFANFTYDYSYLTRLAQDQYSSFSARSIEAWSKL